jgi:hypothetical protein
MCFTVFNHSECGDPGAAVGLTDDEQPERGGISEGAGRVLRA